MTFTELDLTQGRLDERFDVVVATEILEHCDDFGTAFANLAAMTRRYLVVTVPCGPVFPIDRMVGHVRHPSPGDFIRPAASNGLEPVRLTRWGFPFFNLYKHVINLSPQRMAESFMSKNRYSKGQKLLAAVVYWAFQASLPIWGYQLVALFRRPGAV